MKTSEAVTSIFILYSIFTVVVVGGLFLWYVIDDRDDCLKYKEANPNINFEWNFSDGCIFQLPDGTWINLREYKNQNEYELEIEK